jgi:hypothetical protein
MNLGETRANFAMMNTDLSGFYPIHNAPPPFDTSTSNTLPITAPQMNNTVPAPAPQLKPKRTYKKREKKPLGPSAFDLAIPAKGNVSLGSSKEPTEILTRGKGKAPAAISQEETEATAVVASNGGKEKERELPPLLLSTLQESVTSVIPRAEDKDVVEMEEKDGDLETEKP